MKNNKKLILLLVENRPDFAAPCIPQQTCNALLRFHHRDAVSVYDHSVRFRGILATEAEGIIALPFRHPDSFLLQRQELFLPHLLLRRGCRLL